MFFRTFETYSIIKKKYLKKISFFLSIYLLLYLFSFSYLTLPFFLKKKGGGEGGREKLACLLALI